MTEKIPDLIPRRAKVASAIGTTLLVIILVLVFVGSVAYSAVREGRIWGCW